MAATYNRDPALYGYQDDDSEETPPPAPKKKLDKVGKTRGDQVGTLTPNTGFLSGLTTTAGSAIDRLMPEKGSPIRNAAEAANGIRETLDSGLDYFGKNYSAGPMAAKVIGGIAEGAYGLTQKPDVYAKSQAAASRNTVGSVSPTQDKNKTSGKYVGPPSANPNDPMRMAARKAALASLSAGETNDTGRYPQGGANSDAFERGLDERAGQQIMDNGSHVYADYTDPRTGEKKHANYTSAATNPAAAALLGQDMQDTRAPRLGTEGGDANHQMLAMRDSGSQDPYGGNIRPVHTVSNPGTSFIQGTPEQQQAEHYEDLQRKNAIAQQEYQNEYLSMNPEQRARVQAMQRPQDPRTIAIQHGLAIYQEGIQKSAYAVERFRKLHPQATEAQLKQVHESEFAPYQGVTQFLSSIFHNSNQFPSEYTPPPQGGESPELPQI